jgi:TPR repeat protein
MQQETLGLRFLLGDGIPKDYAQGYAWLSVASANGSKTAPEYMEKYEKKMSQTQIKKSQKLAKEIWAKMNKANEKRK